MKRTVFIVLTVFLIVSCGGDNTQKQAEQLLSEATNAYEAGRYDETRVLIDSLRKLCPNAIDVRKKALKLQQEMELKKAQAELAKTDSLLQAVQHDYDYQQTKVEKDKAALRATPEELTMLTRTRMRRDSLRTQCEVFGGKIRYIHKKQKELK